MRYIMNWDDVSRFHPNCYLIDSNNHFFSRNVTKRIRLRISPRWSLLIFLSKPCTNRLLSVAFQSATVLIYDLSLNTLSQKILFFN